MVGLVSTVAAVLVSAAFMLVMDESRISIEFFIAAPDGRLPLFQVLIVGSFYEFEAVRKLALLLIDLAVAKYCIERVLCKEVGSPALSFLAYFM